jgi:glycosyltransferase involved in cell wall biosynthesis
MGRALKIGLHSPFFGSTLGGGEKYLAVAAEALRDGFPQHQVEIVGPVPVDRYLYERTLGVDLSGIGLRSASAGASRLRARLNAIRLLRRLRNVALARQAMHMSRDYDLFITMVYVIPAVSRARKSVIFCQFPYEVSRRPWSGVWARELGNFDSVVCYSEFVRDWIKTYWERDAKVIAPPIDIPAEAPKWNTKQPMILSVGRFFSGGHSKRQDVLVRAFREMCDAGLRGWELHLAGAVHRDAQNAQYFDSIRTAGRDYPIVFHPDCSYSELQALYRDASVFWHAAGFGVDADVRPIDLEHFGMTTAEAMGNGVVPVVLAQGGQLEVVRDEVDGFLWNDLGSLKQRTKQLVADAGLRRSMGEVARNGSQRFSRLRFYAEVVALVQPLVAELEG